MTPVLLSSLWYFVYDLLIQSRNSCCTDVTLHITTQHIYLNKNSTIAICLYVVDRHWERWRKCLFSETAVGFPVYSQDKIYFSLRVSSDNCIQTRRLRYTPAKTQGVEVSYCISFHSCWWACIKSSIISTVTGSVMTWQLAASAAMEFSETGKPDSQGTTTPKFPILQARGNTISLW